MVARYDPFYTFLERNADRLRRTYKGVVKTNNFDGQLIGRDAAAAALRCDTAATLPPAFALRFHDCLAFAEDELQCDDRRALGTEIEGAED